MRKPRLIILCGLPGSGKSTYAEKHSSKTCIHLSSDAIRTELYGNAEEQKDHEKVFEVMKERALEYLNNGYDVIYDATNITRKSRAAIITAVPKFVTVECKVIWEPIVECVRRDSERERTVGEAVIFRMAKHFQAPFYDEGIHDIEIIKPEKFFGEYGDEWANLIMERMEIPHDNHNHTKDIYDHCTGAHQYISKKVDSPELKHATLIHDIGKPFVKTFTDRRGNPTEEAHYYQHQCVGAWLSYGFNYTTPYIAWLVSTHMDVFLNTKYYRSLPKFLKREMDLLHEADLAAH